MFTAVVVGWTSPFRQVPRGTMVAGVTVLVPILIPGTSVMPISACLSPGHAIGPRWAYDLQLNSARTTLCGWFVRLGFRLVVRWSVRFLTLLLLRSQGFFRSMDFNTIVHRFLQHFWMLRRLFSWAFGASQFSVSHDSETTQGVCLLHSWSPSLNRHC